MLPGDGKRLPLCEAICAELPFLESIATTRKHFASLSEGRLAMVMRDGNTSLQNAQAVLRLLRKE